MPMFDFLMGFGMGCVLIALALATRHIVLFVLDWRDSRLESEYRAQRMVDEAKAEVGHVE